MNVGKNNIDRKVYTLKDYRGVDYASSPLEVQPYRATDMANLLLRDGVLQKRHGFRQLAKVTNDNVKKLFSLADMGIDSAGMQVLLQTDSYKNGEPITVFKRYIVGAEVVSGQNQYEINGHYKAASGFALDGHYYLLVPDYGMVKLDKETLEFKLLTQRDMYAPTTTINIPLSGYTANDKPTADTDIKYPYTSNETINMLTAYRVNRLKVKQDLAPFNGKGTSGGDYLPYFQLDGRPIEGAGPNPDYDFSPSIQIDGEEVGEFVWDNNRRVWVNSTLGVEMYSLLRSAPYYPPEDLTNRGMLLISNPTAFKNKLINKNVDEYGYVTIDVRYHDAATYVAQGTTYAGLYSVDAWKVINSTCLTTFGVDGADDRIFVGGSADTPNIVYFSENDISLKPNPTYFPANQFLVCGSAAAPVTGFLRVADGTMAILKRTTDLADRTVYYTSGTYSELTDEIGNTHYEARFTIKAGDIARRGVSAGAITNFEGDNIFVSETGVYGIQLSDNVASGERYAKERSRTINPRITKLGLPFAKGVVYENKYFLAVNGGEVYVADSRYKYTQKGDQADTFNYEWFRLTGLFVNEWFNIGNKLYFVDKDGYICKFTEKFTDEYLLTGTAGLNELSVSDGKVTFNSERLELIKSASYAVDDNDRVWQITLTADETAFYIPEDIENVNDGDSLTLWFCVPVVAYWQSAVLDLGAPVYLKNMWSLSMVASAKHGGKINLGYKTRMNSVSGIQVEGANEGSLADISLFGGEQVSSLTGDKKTFGMFTFDMGGYVGINTYRRRFFDRNFAHIQLLFTSETTTDCAVAEMDIEYAIARKNIGVG